MQLVTALIGDISISSVMLTQNTTNSNLVNQTAPRLKFYVHVVDNAKEFYQTKFMQNQIQSPLQFGSKKLRRINKYDLP